MIDGTNELGQMTCKRAMELAIEKARRTGVGVVSTRNLGDTGMLGYYTTLALKHDCIGFMCVPGMNAINYDLSIRTLFVPSSRIFLHIVANSSSLPSRVANRLPVVGRPVESLGL